MAHTYEDALLAERAAAAARGDDTGEMDKEIKRISSKLAEPKGIPEELGSPSAGHELVDREHDDPDLRHAGRSDVKKAGGGSASEQRQSGRSQRGTNAGKVESGKTTTPPAKTEQDKAVESGSGSS